MNPVQLQIALLWIVTIAQAIIILRVIGALRALRHEVNEAMECDRLVREQEAILIRTRRMLDDLHCRANELRVELPENN